MATRITKSASSYTRVKQEILHRIQSGVLPPGGLLPGEIELAHEFDVARGTVNRAMKELVELGYLERRRKGGTRVRSSPLRAATFPIPLIRSEIESGGSSYSYELLSRNMSVGPDDVRQALQIWLHRDILHLLCLHRANGVPFQVEERWINLETLPEAEYFDFGSMSPNEWLVKKAPYTDVEMKLSSNMPPPHINLHINCGEARALLMMQRTTWLNGKSVTHVRMHYHAAYELITRY